MAEQNNPLESLRIDTPERTSRFDYYFGIIVSGVCANSENVDRPANELLTRARELTVEALYQREQFIVDAQAGRFDAWGRHTHAGVEPKNA